ncbi:hypothetical protein [Singulisphaera sp. PoT]|uniref:hypothetical protein n=1 Tax=Singulisphaera sp. PoT TaxID=3411797 RepID=UPI003BF5C23C
MIADKCVRYRCDLGTTEILLAAERHRRKTGHWPNSLDAIDPRFLAKPQVDLYALQAFHFEHREGQLLVYSPGPNHLDDQGPSKSGWKRPNDPDDVGTIGWDLSLRRQPASASTTNETDAK